jgi:hypothetical protein
LSERGFKVAGFCGLKDYSGTKIHPKAGALAEEP